VAAATGRNHRPVRPGLEGQRRRRVADGGEENTSMGTRWQGLLAPVNEPTDDARRFLEVTVRTLPLSLKWQRVDAMGHDDSVVVGSLETVNFGTVSQAVDAG